MKQTCIPVLHRFIVQMYLNPLKKDKPPVCRIRYQSSSNFDLTFPTNMVVNPWNI